MPRGRPARCIYCGSTDTASKGSRTTKTMGIRKIRRCRSCGRRFTPRNQKMVQQEEVEARIEMIEPVEAKTTRGAPARASETTELDMCEVVEANTPATTESEELANEHHAQQRINLRRSCFWKRRSVANFVNMPSRSASSDTGYARRPCKAVSRMPNRWAAKGNIHKLIVTTIR